MENDNEVVKSESKNTLKTLSKVIYVFAKIGKIFAIIGAVFASIGIITGIVFVSNFNINKKNDNNIEFKMGNIVVEYKDENNKIYFDSQGQKITFDDAESVKSIRIIINEVTKMSKENIIGYLVATLIFTIAGLVILAVLLDNVHKLFKNIAEEDTPFSMDNVKKIKTIGWLMVASTLVTSTGNSVCNTIINNNNSNFNFSFNILLILIVFAAAYIFEYGCKIQEKTN